MWPAYSNSTASTADALGLLRRYLTDVPARLGVLTESALVEKVPGKWSRKEVLGHLIDSALNNLKRFTEARFAVEPHRIQSYDQNQLVVVNMYQTLPVTHLLTLWGSLNTQILYVAEAIPLAELDTPISFADPNAANVTLGWLINDYVGHLEHHLRTLL